MPSLILEFVFYLVAVPLTLLPSDSQAILSGTLLNVGTVLYSTARAFTPPATAALVFSAVLALQVVIGNLKVRKLDKTEASISGAAL